MAFLSKYGVARHIYVPVVKRAVVDFAVGADWTPAAGDVKISKDGGAAANVTNLPTAIAMGNGAMWDFSLTATEMQAAQIMVTVVDAATKAVEDTMFIVETYGNASAEHAFDLGTAMSAQAVASVSGAVGSVTGAVGSVTGAVGSVTGAVGSVTGNVGGNVVGSVASVTGAVGSVTGNVGGNVVGSVASVTGAVGSVTGNVGGNVVGSVASVTAAVATTSNIKKNQALAKFPFLLTDSTTHAPKTGAVVTVTRSIDGAAQAAGTLSAVTEVGNGIYTVDFAAADLNGNTIILRGTAAGADDVFERIVTQP